MSNELNKIFVIMPVPGTLPMVEYLWQLLAARWGLPIEISYPEYPVNTYQITYRNGNRGTIGIAYEPENALSNIHIHQVDSNGRTLRILASAENLTVQRVEGKLLIQADVISPLLSIIQFREEEANPLRDRFGLVEGKNSARYESGVLSEPLFENLACWVQDLLGFPSRLTYSDGSSWAVAVSCDIDVLTDNHLPAVLQFMEKHDVDCPTFMICSATSNERTIRDPEYNLSDQETLRFLSPLKSSHVEVGLHGSYFAHDQLVLLQGQKSRLEAWWKQPVVGHRAHFYRFAYPRSWAWQYRAGFRYDASLGYPDQPGFRSPYASPAMFYDPEYGFVPFVTVPTAILDQHFFWPEPWSKKRFEAYVSGLINRVAQVNGVLTIDWHTYTINQKGYPNWWDRLDFILEMSREAGAYIAGIGKIVEKHVSDWNLVRMASNLPVAKNFSHNDTNYFEQSQLWNNPPEIYQIQARADILDLLPPEVESILDVGCGDGFITNVLPDHLHVVGMDLSRNALHNVQRDVCLGSLIDLPFADASFDLVMANDVLEHIPEAEYSKALAELRRVAKKYILITVPFAEDRFAHQIKCGECGTIYHINHHQRSFEVKDMVSLFDGAIEPTEIRFSGDITRPSFDPTATIRQELGIFISWSNAICPNCSSKLQIDNAAGTRLVRFLDNARSCYWARHLKQYGPGLMRSEVLALYVCEPSLTQRIVTEPAVIQDSLLKIDFTNPLQRVSDFTIGTPWAKFLLPPDVEISSEGIRRGGTSPNSTIINIRILVECKVGDCIRIEISGNGEQDGVKLYSVDGETSQEILLDHVRPNWDSPREVEYIIDQPWMPDKFGLVLNLYLEGNALLRTIRYISKDGDENAVAQFVTLQAGHNVIGIVHDNLLYSWGILVDHPARIPCVDLNPNKFLVSENTMEVQSIFVEQLRETFIAFLEAKDQQRSVIVEQLRDAQSIFVDQLRETFIAFLEAKDQQRSVIVEQLRDAEQQYAVLQGEHQAVIEQLNKRIGFRGGALEILRSIKRRLLGILGIGSRIWRRLFYLPEAVVTTENFPFPWEPITTPLPSVDGQLRVLVLSHMFPHPNQPGSGSFVFEQVKALREYTHIDVRVLAGQPDWILSRNPIHVWLGLMAHNKKFNSSGWWNLFGVPTKYIPYRILAPFWSHGWMYRLAMMRAIKSLRVEFPFDLIHAHTGYLDGSAGQAIARRFGVPLLITEHTGPFSVLTSNPIVKHDTLRSLNNATRVIAVSAAQKRNVAVHMSPKSHENIRIIPNGVDTNVFYPAEQWKPNPLAPRIFFVGYFAPVKNIPLLIEAFALVQSELHEAQLTLVGGGEAQQVSEIKKLINQMELNQAVAIIGYESRDEIARMMREECDMLVLSSDAETFGVVLIEALASGRPVVATRCGGPEDIVNDPALGELCSPGDAQALAAAILKVARRLPQYNPDQIRENAVKRFAYERIAEAVSREYVDVLHLVAKKK